MDRWLQDVANALNDLPAFSTFSGNPNTSGETADAGVLGFNIASSQSLLWVNTSGTTSGWSTLDYR